MMKIHFYIRFHTHSGQSLRVTGNLPDMGGDDQGRSFALTYMNHEFWHGVLEADNSLTPKLRYRYILRNADGLDILEGANDRVIDLTRTGLDEIRVVDTWNYAGEYENVFFTDPFQETLLKEQRTPIKGKSPKRFNHIFKVKAPLLRKNEVICLCGRNPVLGGWDEKKVLLLGRENGWWSVKLKLPREAYPLEYKYGIYNTKEKKFLRYESGENRVLYSDLTEKSLTILHDGFVHLPNNTWRGAGVSIPVFSLRSKNSFGVGEFTDLKLLADWAGKCGLKMIQILPVNDTTATRSWQDSYPYAAISAFALHPIYLNIETVAGKEHAALIKPLKKKQKQLNELPDLDYEEVMKFKIPVLRELFNIRKEEFLQDEDFLEFFEKSQDWLVPYAAFCYLRDRNGTSDFNQWKVYSRYKKDSIEKYVSPKAKHYNDIAFQYFLQYHLHLQLKDAVNYAHRQGIILKGDIPIGIYRYGCDAWVEPELYHMDMQAGAPPDDFAKNGQNWGFPTYHWEHMAKNGFHWWNRRFVQMSNYYDAFRIDHILGFFRIWSIPIESVEGIMGRFDPALPVHADEFGSWGIPFDPERYGRPFINEAVLWEMFGPNKDKFLPFLSESDGSYRMKPEFNNQHKVFTHFAGLDQNEENKNILQGLFDLLSNVILFEEPGSGGKKFHFRFNMQDTISFRHLDENTKRLLRDLYVNYFFRRQDDFWMKEAMKKLPALKSSTNMMVCGEDLGLVPHCVPDVMKQLGILSLEIQRMPKATGKEFFHPADAPYLSVVTPSTHDMSTIRGWWEEDRGKTQRFYNNELGQWGEAPYFCEPWINRSVVIQHLYSPAMWAVFQLQDLLGMSNSFRRQNPHEERINVPANPRHYWKYRMHISLEELIRQKEFNQELSDMVEASGRDR